MRYFKKLVGPRLYLSPINIEDAPIYTKWINDPAVSIYFGTFEKTVSLLEEKKILEQMAEKGHNYSIILEDGDRLLGNISLNNVDHLDRCATLGVFIGDTENHGKGYGAEAIRLLLDYGFRVLNLHSIMLSVYEDNQGAMACYKKVGFKEMGRRRESHNRNGKLIDVVYMDILEHDFYAGKKDTIL